MMCYIFFTCICLFIFVKTTEDIVFPLWMYLPLCSNYLTVCVFPSEVLPLFHCFLCVFVCAIIHVASFIFIYLPYHHLQCMLINFCSSRHWLGFICLYVSFINSSPWHYITEYLMHFSGCCMICCLYILYILVYIW